MKTLLLFLALITPVKAAIAVVASDLTGGNGTTATSASLNTTGSTSLWILSAWYSAGGTHTVTVSDSKSNTWTCRTARDNATQEVQICYASNANPTVGSGHTFQVTGASSFCVVGVIAFSGTATSAPQDTESGNTGNNVIANGSITPTNASSAIITVLSWLPNNTSESATIDNSATIPNQIAYSAGSYYAAAIAYKLNVSSALNLTWTLGATGGGGAVAASFVIPAGAATGRIKHGVTQ